MTQQPKTRRLALATAVTLAIPLTTLAGEGGFFEDSTATLAALLRTALVISSATPQYTATDAAVWPE